MSKTWKLQHGHYVHVLIKGGATIWLGVKMYFYRQHTLLKEGNALI